MMTGTSTACPLFSTQLRTRSFYPGDKRAGMESLGVQRLPSGQRNRPRDLNFYIMQRAKSLRQIDRKVRARNRCSGCTRAAPCLSRRGRGGEPDQAAPAFGEGLVPGLSRLRDRPAPSLAPQHQALAPDAGARLLRLRDQHQSPHPPPQGNVPSARARAGGQVRPTDPAGGKHGLLDETATIGTRGGNEAGGAGVPDAGAPADQTKKRKERKGRRERTTKLTKSAKKERTPEVRNARVRGILFVWAASLAPDVLRKSKPLARPRSERVRATGLV